MPRLLRASLVLAVLSALALTNVHAEMTVGSDVVAPPAPAGTVELDPDAASAALALLGIALIVLSDWRGGPPEPESIVCRSYFRKRKADQVR